MKSFLFNLVFIGLLTFIVSDRVGLCGDAAVTTLEAAKVTAMDIPPIPQYKTFEHQHVEENKMCDQYAVCYTDCSAFQNFDYNGLKQNGAGVVTWNIGKRFRDLLTKYGFCSAAPSICYCYNGRELFQKENPAAYKQHLQETLEKCASLGDDFVNKCYEEALQHETATVQNDFLLRTHKNPDAHVTLEGSAVRPLVLVKGVAYASVVTQIPDQLRPKESRSGNTAVSPYFNKFVGKKNFVHHVVRYRLLTDPLFVRSLGKFAQNQEAMLQFLKDLYSLCGCEAHMGYGPGEYMEILNNFIYQLERSGLFEKGKLDIPQECQSKTCQYSGSNPDTRGTTTTATTLEVEPRVDTTWKYVKWVNNKDGTGYHEFISADGKTIRRHNYVAAKDGSKWVFTEDTYHRK